MKAMAEPLAWSRRLGYRAEMPNLRGVAIMLALPSLGCSMSVRIAVGPTIDTAGQPGLDVSLVLNHGHPICLETDEHVMMGGPRVGGGLGDGGSPMVIAGAELGYFNAPDEDERDLVVRGAAAFSSRHYLGEPTTRSWYGGGLGAGAYYRLHHDWLPGGFGGRWLQVGAELHGEMLRGPEGTRGVFSLPLVFEAYRWGL